MRCYVAEGLADTGIRSAAVVEGPDYLIEKPDLEIGLDAVRADFVEAL